MYVYVSKQVGYVCNEMPKEEKKKSQKERKKLNEWRRRKKCIGGFFSWFFGWGGRVKGLAALKDVVSLA